MTDVARLICGLAVPFDEPSEDGALIYQRSHFERFAELGGGLPLMFAHEPLITQRGAFVPHLGRAVRFALLDAQPPVPAGMLALAAVDEGPFGDSLLAEVRRGEKGITGMSLACHVVRDDSGAIEIAWPFELSLGHNPRFDLARIVGTGPAALSAWEMLAGQAASLAGLST